MEEESVCDVACGRMALVRQNVTSLMTPNDIVKVLREQIRHKRYRN